MAVTVMRNASSNTDLEIAGAPNRIKEHPKYHNMKESSSFKRKRDEKESRSHSMLESNRKLEDRLLLTAFQFLREAGIPNASSLRHKKNSNDSYDLITDIDVGNTKKVEKILHDKVRFYFPRFDFFTEEKDGKIIIKVRKRTDGGTKRIIATPFGESVKKATKILTKEEFGKLSDLYSKCEWSSNEADFDRWNDYCEELGTKYIEDENCLDYYLERYGQFVVPEKIDSFIYDVVEQGLANIEDDDEWEPLESYGKVYYALGDGDSQGNWQFVSDEFDTIEDAKKWRDEHGRPEYFVVKTNIGGAEPLKESKINEAKRKPKADKETELRKKYGFRESKEERKSDLDSIVKTTTGYTTEEIENEFDCTILALHRHRKEEYVIFIDDHDDGAACLYASDIREHFEPTSLEYVIVTHSSEKMRDAVNSGKVDGEYTEIGSPEYTHDNPRIHLYCFTQDTYGMSEGDYYDSELWTGLTEKDIERLEKDVEEFNNIVGDTVLEIIERGSFEDGSDQPSEEELEEIGEVLGELISSDGEF